MCLTATATRTMWLSIGHYLLLIKSVVYICVAWLLMLKTISEYEEKTKAWKNKYVSFMGDIRIFFQGGIARKFAYKIKFRPFETNFTDGPRIIRIQNTFENKCFNFLYMYLVDFITSIKF